MGDRQAPDQPYRIETLRTEDQEVSNSNYNRYG